jgi:lycopene cyclase domain-containing protein
LLRVSGLLLIAAGMVFHEKLYTASSFILLGLFIMIINAFPRFFRPFNAAYFLVSYGSALLPFLLVNGFLTALPVVTYNNRENLGIRMYTIPVEDIFYGMLLMMMVISVFEKLRHRTAKYLH